jgi:hypothetical protein
VSPAPALVGGQFPPGRWHVSIQEAQAAYCSIPNAQLRADLWQEWTTLTGAVRGAVGHVASAWLGGSFFTDKPLPDDIDCVYIIDRDHLKTARADPAKAAFLQAIAGDGAKTLFHLRVDCFILEWWPRPGVNRGSADRRGSYLENRGYWDDLWPRTRDRTNLRMDAIPRRGYLEVMLDGYK